MDLSTGCISFETITLTPPPVPDVPLVVEGCEGEVFILTIGNFDLYEEIVWCDGFTNGASYELILSGDETCFFTATDFSGCEIVYEIDVNVGGISEVEISGSTSFCAGSSSTLCATTVSSGQYLWSTGETTECIVVAMAGNYSVTVQAEDCSSTSEVNVSVGSSLSPIINGGDICVGESTTLSVGSNYLNYNWIDAAGNNLSTTSEVVVTQGGVYTVEVSDGSCSGTASYTVNEFEPPTVNIINSDPICNSSATGDPTIIDLSTLVSGSSGVWKDDNGNVLGTTVVDFEGYATGVYDFCYSTNEATGPCMDFAFTVPILVIECNCPIISLVPASICNDFGSLELNNLIGLSAAGSFTYDNGPTPNISLNGTVFDVTGVPPGVYNFIYTLDTPVPGCPESGILAVEVVEAVNVDIGPDLIVCSTLSASGVSSIDFSELQGDQEGVWTTPDNYPGAFSDLTNVSFLDLPAGSMYVFSFTADAQGVCSGGTDELLITVIDCDCPNVMINEAPDLCNNESFFLDDLLMPSTVPGSFVVETILGEGVATPGNIFEAQGVEPGSYVIFFTPDIAPPPDCPQMSSVDFEVLTSDLIDLGPDQNVCSVISLEGDHFFNFLEASGTLEGVWMAPENFPMVLEDFSNVSFLDLSVGSSYTFTFTGLPNGPCPAVTEELTISVVECLVSVKELEFSPVLNIFPNPSAGQFNIELERNLRMKIYDFTGRAVGEQNLMAGVNALQMGDRGAGVYLVEFYDEGLLVGVEKLIVY